MATLWFMLEVGCGDGASAPTQEMADVCRSRTCGSASLTADFIQLRNLSAPTRSMTALGISAGGLTCALTSADGVVCWGLDVTDLTGPHRVPGLSTGVIGVSVGADHVCALTPAGAVKCWGDNTQGQLGDGSTVSRATPTQVVGLSSEVIAISDTCAVTAVGAVKCWGKNNFGQLGDGSWVSRSVPVDVAGLSSGVVSVSSGGNDACALSLSGAVKCWGWAARSSTPTDVVGLTADVVAISVGGGFTCALTAAGGVKCWGMNDSGQLGSGSKVGSDAIIGPVDVQGLSSGVIAISAGSAHACAITAARALKCWGQNAWGQIGDGSTVNRYTPVDVVGLSSGITAVAAGDEHTCAVTRDGAVKCWGLNAYGELGDGTKIERHVPVEVIGF